MEDYPGQDRERAERHAQEREAREARQEKAADAKWFECVSCHKRLPIHRDAGMTRPCPCGSWMAREY